MGIVAYKAFKKGLIATRGNGVYQYKEGVNEFPKAKCVSEGAHCAEDPLDVFNYYSPGNDTEYRIVIASGDIDESEGDSKIACTRLIIKRELSLKELLCAALLFWKKHPERSRSDYSISGFFKMIADSNPILKGKKGEILCFARKKGKIIDKINIFEIDGADFKPDIYYNISGKEANQSEQ